jgi:hypothetical protein
MTSRLPLVLMWQIATAMHHSISPTKKILMTSDNSINDGQFVHIVTLDCKDSDCRVFSHRRR